MNWYKVDYVIFSRIAKIKRCGSCFRCEERGCYSGFLELSVKPRKGMDVKCCSACSPECKSMEQRACEWWYPRWLWNLRQKWWSFHYSMGRKWIENVRMPLGALRKPVALEWEDGLNLAGELSVRNDPRCPHCGEMPYSLKQCQFCGQRFLEVDDEQRYK